jgi:hypothetical protein
MRARSDPAWGGHSLDREERGGTVVTRPEYRIVIEASFSDKVRAIRGLVELYRRMMPERLADIERAAASRSRPDAPVGTANPR